MFEKRSLKYHLVIVVFYAFWMGNSLMAAPPGLIILERADRDLDFFQKEFIGITRSLGPSPESQGIQTMIQMIRHLKRELWLAKKLLLVKDAVKSEEDQQSVRFIIRQDFAELIVHAQGIVTRLKTTLQSAPHRNSFHYNQELAKFLEAYIEGLRFVRSNL